VCGGAVVLAAALTACATGGGAGQGTPPPANLAGGLPAVLTHTVGVTVTAGHGCQADHGTYAAGELLVSITNQDALGVRAVQLRNGAQIVGERDNIPAGFTGSFAVTAPPGRYTVFCPGAAGGQVAISIVGASMPDAGGSLQQLLDAAGTNYGHYVTAQTGELVTAVTALQAAVAHGNTAAAQSAYAKAHAAYERIAKIAEPFDAEINAREGEGADWTGFHRIEKGLFQQKSTAGLSEPSAWLLDHARKLQSTLAKAPLDTEGLFGAAMDLLTGVFRGPLLGEEERYSHFDLLDVSSNADGSAQAYASLQPALHHVDPMLTGTLDQAYGALRAQLDRYRCSWTKSGFDPFGELSAAQLTGLAQAVQAVVEPLSMVEGKLVSG
jgi:iron uptake system component EfeO